MILAMSRPWKHLKSGVYWLRKRVPDDLRKLVGKREEKRSLLTRDASEAKRRHAEALAELETRWANLRSGPKTLTEREAHQIAAPMHDRWLAQHRDNPSSQTVWDIELAVRLFQPLTPSPSGEAYNASFLGEVDKDFVRVHELEAWCLGGADECLAVQGLRVGDDSRRTLASPSYSPEGA